MPAEPDPRRPAPTPGRDRRVGGAVSRAAVAALLVAIAAHAAAPVGRLAHAGDAVPAAPARAAGSCPGLPIHLLGGTPAEREAVCRGSADAIAFFEANGVSPPDRVDVEIGTPLPEPIRDAAAGCYDRSTRRVLLVGYERLLSFGTWFGQPVVPTTYHALAVHEIAHAIAGCRFSIPDPSHRAHEFVAYAALLERMDPGLRERILAEHPDDGAGDARLTDLVHGLAPTRFAVDAWLFWRQPENGPALLRQVLQGEALRGDGGP
jgi:hypothetical protein